MSRISNGLIKVTTEPGEMTNKLITSVVIRSKSGPEGFVFIDNEDMLKLYFEDSLNYQSYRRMVNGGVNLLMAKQSNPEGYPDYSIRLCNNKDIPIVYPISTIQSQSVGEYTQKDLGKLVLDENYTLAYELNLINKMEQGDYIILPLLSIESQCMIICGSPSTTEMPFSAEYFRDVFYVNPGVDASTQLKSIKDHLIELKYEVEQDGSQLIVYSNKAYPYKNYYKLSGNSSWNKSMDYNHKLLIDYTDVDKVIQFTSKIYGPRYKDIEIEIDPINYSTDFYLLVKLGEYVENFTVEFHGGTNHYVEDVLLESKLISAEMLVDDLPDGFNPGGKYKFYRDQDPLEQSEDLMKDRWNELEEWDVLHYILLDDGFNSQSYLKLLSQLKDQYDAYLFTVMNTDEVSDLILSYPQLMEDEDDMRVLPYTPVLPMVYDQVFLGPEEDFIVHGSYDPNTENGYQSEQYVTFNDNIISTSSKDAIEMLIIRAFTKRFSKKIEIMLGMDSNFDDTVSKCIVDCSSLVPMLDYVKVIELVRVNLHLLKIYLELKVIKYSKGTILLNFNVKL